ncbi:MAG: metallophosphoesterase [Limisphaera sp.]|nr:metallophosphoesterase [Limisphaera sp.]
MGAVPEPAEGTAGRVRLALASDIHYAGPREQARGEDADLLQIPNPIQRAALRCWRHRFWMRHPLGNNALLDRFLEQAEQAECTHAIVNGDYAADTASLGLSDEGTWESACLCVHRLRKVFGDRLRLVIGDHELGKLSFFGHYGGLRLASWERATKGLGLAPVWVWDLGVYRLIAVTSTLVALPMFRRDMLPEERPLWEHLRRVHLEELAAALQPLAPHRRWILFCHDPTALPFLAELPAVRQHLDQVALTVIGHLHSPLILWKSWLLAGMPRVRRLGVSVERMSGALRQAAVWKQFRVRLCPSLAGIQLERGGGWVELELSPAGDRPFGWRVHKLRRESARVHR